MIVVHAVDPRTGFEGEGYPAATVADVDAALAAAIVAARSAEPRDESRRTEGLRRAAAALRSRADEIVALAEAETGLPEARLRGELERTAAQAELLADYVTSGEHHDAIIDLADPDARPTPRPDLRRTKLPLGPVAVFGAGNFPLAFSTLGGDTASALAAGCPVIVKGHPSHPGTGTLVAGLLAASLAEAGLPAGTFSHVLAADLDVAEALVDHPATAAVAFTGSFRAGSAILARANARPTPIPVYAEMGSLNPVVVTAGAAAARGPEIAAALAASVGTFGGQLCTKPGLVFVPAGGDIAAMLGEALAGHGPQVLLNAGIHAGFERGVAAIGARAEPLIEDGAAGPGFTASPAAFRIDATAFATEPSLWAECFGPAVIVVEYSSNEQLDAALGVLEGQLTAAVYAEPEEHAALVPLVDRLTAIAGRVLFDGVPTGVAVTTAMHHGGPWPATSAAASTSVGATAVERFLRPVTFQNSPDELLPPALRNANPLRISRRVNGIRTRDSSSAFRPAIRV